MVGLHVQGDRIATIRVDGEELRFNILYSAPGLRYRTELARQLGACHDEKGALVVDAGMMTNVDGLYAAGNIAAGLGQIVARMSHAAIAATRIHNRCCMPTDDEG